MLADLVSNAARGLAGRLAGGLALAAAAVYEAASEVTGTEGLYSSGGSILTSLVSNAARGLASRLAGGLALAAAAVYEAGVEISGVEGVDSVHNRNSFK